MISPSLECDSGEEDILGHSYPCSSVKQQSVLRSSSGEERDSFETSPDFNRTHSSSSQKSTKVHPSVFYHACKITHGPRQNACRIWFSHIFYSSKIKLYDYIAFWMEMNKFFLIVPYDCLPL